MNDYIVVGLWITGSIVGIFLAIWFISLFPSKVARVGYKPPTDNNFWGNLALGLAGLVFVAVLFIYGPIPKKPEPIQNEAQQIAQNIRQGAGYGTDQELGIIQKDTNKSWRRAWIFVICVCFIGCLIFLYTRRDEVQRGWHKARAKFLQDKGGEANLKDVRTSEGGGPAGASKVAGTISFPGRVVAESLGEGAGIIGANIVSKISNSFFGGGKK